MSQESRFPTTAWSTRWSPRCSNPASNRRGFTRGLAHSTESNSIVRAIIHLCSSLDMSATTEGVETEGQFAVLAQCGGREAQGFLFRTPRPAEEVNLLVVRLELAA